MNKVLVTGGRGLVGNGVRRAAAEVKMEGWEFYYIGREVDLLDYEATKTEFDRIQPSHVVHLAAKVGGLYANMNDQLGFFQQNLQMNHNVLRLCHEYKIHRAILMLSTCVYPSEWKDTLVEEDLHTGAPHYSNEGYAMAKRMLEVEARFYREKYGHSWVCLVPTNIYGPHDNFSLESGHVAPSLMIKALAAKQEKTSLKVLGSGSALRQFIFSVDVGRVILGFLKMDKATLEKSGAWTYIVAGDKDTEIGIGDLAKLIAKSAGVTEGIEFDTTKSDGVHRKTASNARLRKVLPDVQFTSLEDGVRESVAWLEANFEVARR